MDDRHKVVFTPEVRLRGFHSLKVLPLLVGERATGTLVVAAAAAVCFGREALDMLGVIANQAAISIENAKMYRRMELMATTDGLTGLENHRRFQEKLDLAIARARREGRPLALLLADIDHFKTVNDTYGHPVGDLVLKRVASVLSTSAREIDTVARYGGEEFALVLEGTDIEGAMKNAERIRAEVEKQLFTCDTGKFRVTLSLGIAVYPADAEQKHALIEDADQALYQAKRRGRNRAVAFRDA
jgi:diguanylate cyclase (GGDEF)-like protein